MGTHCVWICTLPTYSIYRLEPGKIIAGGRGEETYKETLLHTLGLLYSILAYQH